MEKVISKDGTSIAFYKKGQGPVVILVGGGLVDHSENSALFVELSEHFTVINYDRRGRGQSGDTSPYSVMREIEDIEALIMEAGGSSYLYGISSGGALALEAAAAGLAVEKLAVYETPYNVGRDASTHWKEYVRSVNEAIAENNRSDALELFMQLAGSTKEQIMEAKQSPFWSVGESLAHTLVYDAAVLGDGGVPPHLIKIKQPTLVVTGVDTDPHMTGLQSNFFDLSAQAIVGIVPHAERKILKGQAHVADPKIIAAMLVDFFKTQ